MPKAKDFRCGKPVPTLATQTPTPAPPSTPMLTTSVTPVGAASALPSASITAAASSAPPPTCADAGVVDVSLVYANARESWSPIVVVKIVAPKLKLEHELVRLAGPIDCDGVVRDDKLAWHCSEDMGLHFGEVALDGNALVFRSAYADGRVVPPAGGTPVVSTPPKPVEEARWAWPCGARPTFHTQHLINHAP